MTGPCNSSKIFLACMCVGIFLIAFVCGLCWGITNYSLATILRVFSQPANHSADGAYLQSAVTILWTIRLPRLLVACLCGAALAAAGVLTQGLFRNSLASPSVLGATEGASTAAALVFYLGLSQWQWFTLPLAASFGSLLATGIILGIAKLRPIQGVTEHLLLAGFALNAFFGAITSLLITFVLEDYQRINSLMYWLMGGLNARSWEHVQLGVLPVLFGIGCAYHLGGKLNVLTLGEEVAETLSLKVSTLKSQIVLVVAVLVGAAVSIAGAIGFVGLIIPHITRLLFGPEHRRLLFFSTLNGMTLMLLSDLAARTIYQPTELQVGIITALLGAPFFFYLLLSAKREA